MKFTLSWLKKYLNTQACAEEIIASLNKIGFEVEEVINQAAIYKPFIVAEIISTEKHPEADKLKICQVNNGTETLQIVCGASNVRSGIKVVLAPIGADIPANGLKIKQSKIRNVDSFGMLCSAGELSLEQKSDGIMELSLGKVGQSFAEVYGLNDVIIEISITPNRGDCLGVYGVARDLAAAGVGELNPLKVKITEGDFVSPINVAIKHDGCKKYIGRYFRNIRNAESPDWLKKDLASIGVKPISALVDITNYFTFAFGRPMHAFDADKISQIEIRSARLNEEFLALNDKKYKLNGNELVVADKDQVLGLAGVIGEKLSGVTTSTHNVFLEIGLFDAEAIVQARPHQIDTDAKFRFERKVDSEFMETSLHLVSEMIIDICGGELSNSIVIDNLQFKPVVIDFNFKELEKRLGVSYDKAHVLKILEDLGFKISLQGNNLQLTVPSWRNDISIIEDIVEEVARIDGYDNIKAVALPVFDSANLTPKQKIYHGISRFPASLGLNEVITMSFMHSEKAKLFWPLQDELFIKNPISSVLNYMRPSILPNLLEIAEKNQNRGINNVSIFEMSTIFAGIEPDQQIFTITGLRKGHNNVRNHYHDFRLVDEFDSKGDIFNIINEMGCEPNKLQYSTNNLPQYYHPGRSAALMLGKQIIGYFGLLHPTIIKTYNLIGNAVGFELFIDQVPLAKPKYGRKNCSELSAYQSVQRDFSFIVDSEVTCQKIVNAVIQVDKKLIKSVNIFDIYAGNNLSEGQKSIAFNVVIQAQDRTLVEQEIDELSQKIITSVVKHTNGVLRGA